MGKDKNTTADTNTAAGNASTATEKPKKAAAGSSPAAQAKQLVVAVYTEITERLPEFRDLKITDLMTEGTADWLGRLADEFISNAQRGLPLSTRLQNVENEITAHYEAMPIKNGKAAPDAEWETKSRALMIKKDNLLRAQKRDTAKDKSATATA